MVGTSQENFDLSQIQERAREKIKDYGGYSFNQSQYNVLTMFFDLAQEFESLLDLYRICVVVPYELLQLDSSLYLLDEQEKRLVLVCDSREGVIHEARPVPTGIYLADESYETDRSYVIPIYRKQTRTKKPTTEDFAFPQYKGRLMGMFEVYPLARLSGPDRFFLLKYANRIGFRLHNRQIAQQNIRHLKFISNLVLDIEHNVIIPNMYFRHLFNQLKKKIQQLEKLEKMMRDFKGGENEKEKYEECCKTFAELSQDFSYYHKEIRKHHANVSMFLESLFRREHFEKGHLVLRPKWCLIEKQIIIPQLEHYMSRLKSRGITVDRPLDMVGEEFPITVDVGLLSQVYANLFSNAVKYTEEVIDHRGLPRKAIAYGREIIPNFFGPGQQGVKFNVFTTGKRLSEFDARQIFVEGGRARNSMGQTGSGHGLAFIKYVVELHGGQVGYEATQGGNNFFFILPVSTPEFSDS